MCVGVCVCTGAGGCVRVWVGACVWDEFSEFLLENRVPTSADFNTYPIRIFQSDLFCPETPTWGNVLIILMGNSKIITLVRRI